MKRAVLLTVALLAMPLAPARAETGPPLTADPAALSAALVCPPSFSGTHEPVLLVPGTGFSADTNWSWGYKPALTKLGYDVCTVEIPELSMNDMQVAAQYVVHAVRQIASRSGSDVDIAGLSQGALHPRWAVKWWPDVRGLTDDLVMIVGPNHGTTIADGSTRCTPSCHQMKSTSQYIRALNATDETPGDIDYTSIFTQFDELVHPQLPVSTSAIDGAKNIAIQSVCPARPVTHAGSAADNVTFRLVVDAFSQAGTAEPARLPASICTTAGYPGAEYERGPDVLLGIITGGFPDTAFTAAEPPLEAYASP